MPPSWRQRSPQSRGRSARDAAFSGATRAGGQYSAGRTVGLVRDTDSDVVMRIHRSLIAGALCALCGVAPAPSALAADWSPARVLSGPNSYAPAVSLNSRGDAIAGWTTAYPPSHVEVATRPAGGAFSVPQRMDGWGTPAVRVNEQGAAFAAWTTGDANYDRTLWAASGSAANGLAAGVPLGVRHLWYPNVAFDSHGDAAVAWKEGDSITAAWRPAGQALGPPQTLMTYAHVSDPRVVFDARDVGWLHWDSFQDQQSPRQSWASNTGADGFTAPAQITPNLSQVLVNRSGDLGLFGIAAAGSSYPVPSAGNFVLTVRRAGAPAGPTRAAGWSGALAGFHAAIGDAGEGMAVWWDGYTLKSIYFPPTGPAEQLQALPGSEGAGDFDVGFDSYGNAVVVWRGHSQDWRTETVYAATRPAGASGFEAPQALAEFARSGFSTGAGMQVAFNSTGHGIAVWETPQGIGSSDYTAPVPPPTIRTAAVELRRGGAALRYALARPATVTASLAAARCRTHTKRTCRSYRRIGRITRQAHTGNNRLALTGRRGFGRLRQGRYRLKLAALTRDRPVDRRTLIFRLGR